MPQQRAATAASLLFAHHVQASRQMQQGIGGALLGFVVPLP
jgi:hypothetical protein